MNIYDLVMKPVEAFILHEVRTELISLAEKDVLEIGIGTGVNLPYYDGNKVSSITGLDQEFAKALEAQQREHFNFVIGDIEKLPFATASFDTVVVTLVLCTVDLEKSLQEIKRVLKPGGTFIFIEHIRPHGKLAGHISDKLNRVWPKIAHGCNVNRRTDIILQENHFSEISIRYKGIFCYGHAKIDGSKAEA
ncbi:MAG: class I SAM-dependent methyltransferase [Saezia sp.]